MLKLNKNSLFVLCALFGLSLAHSARADSALTASIADDETGTGTQLTAEQIAQVNTWVQSTQSRLQDLMNQIGSQSASNAKATLLSGIQDAVIHSGGKVNETLTRFVLNRAVKISSDLDQANPKIQDDESLALLIRSVKLAQKYLDSDNSYLNGSIQSTDLPYAQFGADFAEFLLGVNASTLNAQAQFRTGTYALELLRKDLSRQSNSDAYVAPMGELTAYLQQPASVSSDRDAVVGYHKIMAAYQRAVDAMAQIPVLKVSQLRGMTAIAVGVGHSCAIVQGYVWCWGGNRWGQLGNGTTQDSSAPVQVVGLSGVTAITVGNNHSCAIAGGGAFCWGYESVPTSETSSQMVERPTPQPVRGLLHVTQIQAAADHTCAIAGEYAYCWGDNFANVFPNPDAGISLMKDAVNPEQFPGAKNITSIAVGPQHICLLSKGQVLCAGNGLEGEMGRNMGGNYWVDRHGVKPDGVPKSQMINTTGLETCALSGKDLYCWGNGIYEPQKVGALAGNDSSTFATSYHCTSINGMNLCWDQNLYRASVQNASWMMSAGELSGLENIQALELGVGMVSTVAAGQVRSCAVVDLAAGNQQLYCWGQGMPMTRLEAFDHLNPVQYAAPAVAEGSAGTGPLTQQEKDIACMQKLGLSQDQIDQAGSDTIKAMRSMCNGQSQEVEAYKHPIKCAGKRVLKGFFWPFGGGDC